MTPITRDLRSLRPRSTAFPTTQSIRTDAMGIFIMGGCLDRIGAQRRSARIILATLKARPCRSHLTRSYTGIHRIIRRQAGETLRHTAKREAATLRRPPLFVSPSRESCRPIQGRTQPPRERIIHHSRSTCRRRNCRGAAETGAAVRTVTRSVTPYGSGTGGAVNSTSAGPQAPMEVAPRTI